MFAYRVGRVQRPHGLEGDLQIILFRPRRETSHKRRTLSTPTPVALTADDGHERTLALVSLRFVAPVRVIVRFEGVDRNEAETLAGRFLDLDAAHLPEHLTDEVDAAFGREVVDAERRARIGEVVDVRDNGAQPLLVIEAEDGREVLLPWVPQLVRGIEDGVVVATPIPGLLDLE